MAIRRGGVAAVLGLAVLLSVGAGWTLAQERAAERFTSQLRRVPPFFGQVGITPDQREQIYTIRGEYDQKISELTRQLEELKSREMAECESVLTPAQQQLLTQLRAARSNRATAKTAAPTTLDNVETAPPATTTSGNASGSGN